jgi:hypothetical protein
MYVGCILIRHLGKICWNRLEAENDTHTICVPWLYEQHIGNHFVTARKGDEFIAKWELLQPTHNPVLLHVSANIDLSIEA